MYCADAIFRRTHVGTSTLVFEALFDTRLDCVGDQNGAVRAEFLGGREW